MLSKNILWLLSFFTVSGVKRVIAEIKLWVSPWKPVSFFNGLTQEKSTKLNFKELRGKRFVPKAYKLWNAIQVRMVNYCIDRFEKIHGKPNFVRTYMRGNRAVIDVLIMANLPETKEIPIEFTFRQSFGKNPLIHGCQIIVDETEDKIDEWGEPYKEKRTFFFEDKEWSEGLSPVLFSRL